MNKFKIVYYIFIVLLAAVAILLIVSAFPIAGNYKLMIVQSGSMEPAIKMGSVVIVKPADDYKIGDVITFGSFGKRKIPITHRINDLKVIEGKIFYITKGDANEDTDTKEVKKADVLGKVLLSVPYIGYAVDFARKPIGFILIIIVPAAIIIFDEIKNIYQEVKNNIYTKVEKNIKEKDIHEKDKKKKKKTK